MVIDYLTITSHYKDANTYAFNSRMMSYYTDLFEEKECRAVYPYNYNFEYRDKENNSLVLRIRICHNAHNNGFYTYDFYGNFFRYHNIDMFLEDFAETYKDTAKPIKLARIDIKYDTTEYDTNYNPNGLEVKQYICGKGQPTYYYGNKQSLIRVYDKRQEYLDNDNILIEPLRLTRFKFQFRDRYVFICDLKRLSIVCENWLQELLEDKFDIYFSTDNFPTATPKSYISCSVHNFSALDNYCNLITAAYETLGEQAFWDYINLRVNRTKVDELIHSYMTHERNLVNLYRTRTYSEPCTYDEMLDLWGINEIDSLH